MIDTKDVVESLLVRFGSPLYVFDKKAFEENHSHLSSGIPLSMKTIRSPIL